LNSSHVNHNEGEIVLGMLYRKVKEKEYIIYRSLFIRSFQMNGSVCYSHLKNEKSIVSDAEVDPGIKELCSLNGFYAKSTLIPSLDF